MQCLLKNRVFNVNQHGTILLYPNDQAENYTLAQIEDALPTIFGSWWTWRDNIKSNSNPTEAYAVSYTHLTLPTTPYV
jgi:hypothetical protein